MGSTMTCTFLGVIEKVSDVIGKKPKHQSGQLALSLGKTGIEYEITEPSLGDQEPLVQFLAMCRSQEESLFSHEVTDNVSVDMFARAWSTELTTIAKACPNMQTTNPDNDCHEFLMRKAIIAEVCRPLAAVDWKSVSWKQLKKWCPDQKQNPSHARLVRPGIVRVAVGPPGSCVVGQHVGMLVWKGQSLEGQGPAGIGAGGLGR